MANMTLDEAILQQALNSLSSGKADSPKYDAMQLAQMLKFSPSYNPELLKAKCIFDFGPNDIVKDQIIDSLKSYDIEVKELSNGNEQLVTTKFKLPGKMQGLVMKNLVARIPRNTNISFKNGFMTIISNEQTNKTAFAIAYAIANKIDIESALASSDVDAQFQKYTTKNDMSSSSYKIEAIGPIDVIVNKLKFDDLPQPQSMSLIANDSMLDNDTIEMFKFIDKQVDETHTVDDVMHDVRRNKIAQLVKILHNIKKDSGEPFSLLDFEDSTSVSTFIHGKMDDPAAESMPDIGSVTNPLARRRLKLFEDLKHMGGKVFSNAGWVCGICYTRVQNHIFGRFKPAVDENGHIIELANKRDDELEALVQNGKITSDEAKNAISIRDNPKSIRVTEGEYNDRLAETHWCTTGCRQNDIAKYCAWNVDDTTMKAVDFWYRYNCIDNSIFYNDKEQDGPEHRNPYWVFMDLSNGVLFQYSRFLENGQLRNYMMDEDDLTTDGKEPDLHGESGLVVHMQNAFPEFKKMFDIANPPDRELVSMIDKLEFDDDGALLVDREPSGRIPSSVKLILESTSCPSKIRVVCEDASNLFRNLDMMAVQTIDMTNVKNANSMFKNSTLNRDIRIIGSKNCTYMTAMFADAHGLVEVRGLNTQNAKTIESLFRDVQTKNDLELHVHGTLDLRNCTDISYAFKSTRTTRVSMKNIDNVDSALDFVKNCKYLTKLPNLKFPKILSIKQLVSDRNTGEILNYPSYIFGSDTTKALANRLGIDVVNDYLDDIVAYYSIGLKSRIQSMLDENGFMTFTSLNQLSQIGHALSRFKKIRLAFDDDNTYACPSIQKYLVAEEIELQMANCDGLFLGADLSTVKRITGTENVESAKNMFNNAKLNPQLELMRFTNAKHISQMFNQLVDTSTLPKVEFSDKLEDFMTEYSQVISLAKNSSDEAVNRLRQWYDDTIWTPITLKQLNGMFADGVLKIDTLFVSMMNNNPQALALDSNQNYTLMNQTILKVQIYGNDMVQRFIPWFRLRDGKFGRIPDIELVNVTDITGLFYYRGGWPTTSVHAVSVGKIIGLSQVEHADHAFEYLEVDENPVLELEAMPNLKSAKNAFNGAKLQINIPLEFPSLVNGDSMFTSTILQGGKLALNPNGEDYNSMFQSCVTRTPIDLGDFKLNGADCANMFSAAKSVKMKSITITTQKPCQNMFYDTTFVDSQVISKIEVDNSQQIVAFMYKAKGIQEIGRLILKNVRHTYNAFNTPSIDAIYFMTLDNVDKERFLTSTKIMQAYGCASFEEFYQTISLLNDLAS